MKTIISIFLLAILCSCNNKENVSQNQPETAVKPQSSIDPKAFIGDDYLIDDQHSYIGFKIKYFGFSPVRGRFNEFDGTLFYKESNLSDLSVSVFIDAKSINTGNERRDNDLKREGAWFDVKTFPDIKFSSTKIVPKTDGGFDLIGKIRIKDITKVDTIAFSKPTKLSKDWAGNDQVDFSGRITINRQDFKVIGGDFWSTVMENGLTQLSDEVEIEIDIHARKADYQARYNDADSSDLRKVVLDKIKSDGIDAGLTMIDNHFKKGSISSGKLSSIGYTLNTWKMHIEALAVFNKRLEYYPKKTTSWNQIGITNMFLKNYSEAEKNFRKMLDSDSTNSRAHEYLRLLNKMDIRN